MIYAGLRQCSPAETCFLDLVAFEAFYVESVGRAFFERSSDLGE